MFYLFLAIQSKRLLPSQLLAVYDTLRFFVKKMVRMVHSTAQKILWQLLSAPDSWISGNDLAKRFNISRESVWKAINGLRKNGNNIESRRNLEFPVKRYPRDRKTVV